MRVQPFGSYNNLRAVRNDLPVVGGPGQIYVQLLGKSAFHGGLVDAVGSARADRAVVVVAQLVGKKASLPFLLVVRVPGSDDGDNWFCKRQAELLLRLLCVGRGKAAIPLER